jgi:drug/metabolite transporter (DMT)-like permease
MSETSSGSVHHKLALGVALLGATAIGLAPIFVRWSETGSTATAFWRVALSLPFAWVWMMAERRGGRGFWFWVLGEGTEGTSGENLRFEIGDLKGGEARAARFDWRLFVPGIFFAGDLAVWHVSIAWTTVANATLLANCATIFVTLIAWLFFGEKFRWLFPVGMIAAIVGAAVVVQASFAVSSQAVRGDLLGLVTALFYAGYQLSTKRLRARHATGKIMFWSGVAMTVILLAVTLLFGEKIFPDSARGWWVLIGLALVSQVAGQGMITWALAHLPSGFTSVTLLWQPVVAAFVAWLAFGEVLTPWQAVGAVVVLGGIWLAKMGSGTKG